MLDHSRSSAWFRSRRRRGSGLGAGHSLDAERVAAFAEDRRHDQVIDGDVEPGHDSVAHVVDDVREFLERVVLGRRVGLGHLGPHRERGRHGRAGGVAEAGHGAGRGGRGEHGKGQGGKDQFHVQVSFRFEYGLCDSSADF